MLRCDSVLRYYYSIMLRYIVAASLYSYAVTICCVSYKTCRCGNLMRLPCTISRFTAQYRLYRQQQQQLYMYLIVVLSYCQVLAQLTLPYISCYIQLRQITLLTLVTLVSYVRLDQISQVLKNDKFQKLTMYTTSAILSEHS